MEFINEIHIKGIVGNASIQQYNGKRIAHFSVITEYCGHNINQEAFVDITWFNVQAWEENVSTNIEDITKGDAVDIKGRMRYTRYTTPDGTEKTQYTIVAKEIKKVSKY